MPLCKGVNINILEYVEKQMEKPYLTDEEEAELIDDAIPWLVARIYQLQAELEKSQELLYLTGGMK